MSSNIFLTQSASSPLQSTVIYHNFPYMAHPKHFTRDPSQPAILYLMDFRSVSSCVCLCQCVCNQITDCTACCALFFRNARTHALTHMHMHAHTNTHTQVWQIDTTSNAVSRIAGDPNYHGCTDGAALTQARFKNPRGIAVDSRNGRRILMADPYVRLRLNQD